MKTKVLMIVYTRYSLDTRVQREAETLARDSGFEVSVLTPKENSVPRTYACDGVVVKELDSDKYRGEYRIKYIWSYLKFTLFAFAQCTIASLHGNVDIVHVHNMPNFLVFSALVPRILGKKVILDVHDSVPETFFSKFSHHSRTIFRMLCLEERLSCAFASKIICVNHVQRKIMIERKLPKDKITVFMNVPDHRVFDSRKLQKYNSKKKDGFKIVYHGTITKRLGIDLAIQAFSLLMERIPNLEFHLWGEGEFLEECIEISAKVAGGHNIYFHGTVNSHVLPDVLKDMDLGIVSNRKDEATQMMLPVKMLEYIALGIPVVVPKLKGIEYYFSDEMVCYFEPENVASIVNAVLRIYQNESLRKNQTEKAKAFLVRYGWQKQCTDFIHFYKHIRDAFA